MRVLILTAILAYAAAAPSGVALPAAAPTIDPGDIQAAAIDAQVFAEDQARAFAEKVVEQNNEKVIESDSLVKEKTEEAFWSVEDKKWQALDAVKTAEAKLDGAVASNAEAIARSAIGGVIYPTFVGPQLIASPQLIPSPQFLPNPIVRTPIISAPIIPGQLYPGPLIHAPITPIVYTPELLEKKEETLVKTAEVEKDKKTEEKPEEKKAAEPEKPSENAEKPKESLDKPILTAFPLGAPTLKLTEHWVAPIGPAAPVYVPQQVLTPVLKTQW